VPVFFSGKPTAIPLKINGKALKREISKPTFPGGEKKNPGMVRDLARGYGGINEKDQPSSSSVPEE
jgi:hypothetical protein